MDAAAIQDLIRRSNAGDPAAMTEVGRRLLVGLEAPRAPDRGAALILAAADLGWPDALALSAVVCATGIVAPPNWSVAVEQLRRAAAAGHSGSKAQFAILSAADRLTDLTPPLPELISTAPRIEWRRALATPAECEWLIARATGRLEQATVYNAAVGRLDAVQDRSNSLFEFNLAETDLIVLGVRLRIASVLKVAVDRLEPSNVLHYAVGQYFGRHFDFLQPHVPAWAEELRTKGQRTATALIYLNNEFEGGETDFPRLGQRLRGAVGDALLFANVNAWGQPDVDTLHAGLPPTRGEKWLFSQFVRDRAQP